MSAEDAQAQLFPDDIKDVVYEQPLNERMRNCLRLEHLFSSVDDSLDSADEWRTRLALANLIDISDLLMRADIKGELIKELERQGSVLGTLRDNPGVNARALEDTLANIQPLVEQLKSTDCQPGTGLRHNELVSQVKQRISIPGGTCSFDLPGFHFWLSRAPEVRAHHLRQWRADLAAVQAATQTILGMIRSSARRRRINAEKGFFQQQVDPGSACQLVRVVLPSDVAHYPEISGGKHRFAIRFYEYPDFVGRPSQVQSTISFELQSCGI